MPRIRFQNRPLTANRRRPARGVSLIEVLVSLGVLSIGLLSVAALFPVGGHFIRQGEVSDRADAIAASALSDAVARGMLDPERWLAPEFRNAGPSGAIAIHNRPFAAALRSEIGRRSALFSAPFNRNNNGFEGPELARQQLNQLFGSVFVIDPLGVAESMAPGRLSNAGSFALPTTPGQVPVSLAFFPAATRVALAQIRPGVLDPTGFQATRAEWAPWAAGNGAWPVRRLSVATGATPILFRPVAPMVAQAEAMVIANDDLSIELGDYQGNPFAFTPDNPSQQLQQAFRFDPDDTGEPLKPLARLARREFSWFLTVVPTTPEARDGLADNAESFAYDVSAVVSYKRTTGDAFDPDPADPFRGSEAIVLGERQARAAIAATGVGGGEVRVFRNPAGENNDLGSRESPFNNLRAGQWVMLFGPHPDSTPSRPLLFSQWYEVIAVEEDDTADAALFLSGPDWPWRQPAGDFAAATAIVNDLRLVIAPDVVAVHTRTLKLEPGSAWGID